MIYNQTKVSHDSTQDILDTYWYFAAERQRIFFARLRGQDPPWTEDKILQKYKFCNAYRASDRVSQYLIREVIYTGDFSDRDTIFRIILLRLFNRITIWEYLQETVGPVTTDNFDFDSYADALNKRCQNNSIFGGAFILAGQKVFGYDRKHKNYLSLLSAMLAEELPAQIISADNLEEVYKILHAYPLLGDFLSYQLAIDINYSEVVDFSENEFTVAGPGAARGIEKCFKDTGQRSDEEVIQWMVENQEREFSKRDINFPTLFGRKLKAIDCQGLFCEFDKYTRKSHPDLSKKRSQIKANFTPSNEKIEYFYPPKWEINDAVEKVTQIGNLPVEFVI